MVLLKTKNLLSNIIFNSANSDSSGGTSIELVFPILTTLLVVALYAMKKNCATHEFTGTT